MITIPTVLVLGAGASMDFQYPSGLQLKQEILRMVGTTASDDYRILRRLVTSDRDIEAFKNALFSSGKTSVDAFLEHRPEFVVIGKQAIALALVQYENKVTLFIAQSNWYDYLFQRMNSPFPDFSNNKITFVTFNYDRSLEQYLFEALRNSYGKTDDEVAAVLNKIPIIHVHGQLGELPWQGPNGRPYERTTDTEHILNAARGIRIISEGGDVGSAFKSATDQLRSANRIIFLGFGYHHANFDRLALDMQSGQHSYLGSAFGITDHERQEIASLFKPNKVHLGHRSWNVLDFLRESISL